MKKDHGPVYDILKNYEPEEIVKFLDDNGLKIFTTPRGHAYLSDKEISEKWKGR